MPQEGGECGFERAAGTDGHGHELCFRGGGVRVGHSDSNQAASEARTSKSGWTTRAGLGWARVYWLRQQQETGPFRDASASSPVRLHKYFESRRNVKVLNQFKSFIRKKSQSFFFAGQRESNVEAHNLARASTTLGFGRRQ